jgi:hypothetical protein
MAQTRCSICSPWKRPRYYPRHRGLHGLLTKARKVSGGYIVNGEKNHATLMRIEARLMSRRICS